MEDQHGRTTPLIVRHLLLSLRQLDVADSNFPSPSFSVHRTSILIPIPPALYAPIPSFIKSTLLFDFPFYKFNGEGEDAKKAVDEQRGQEEEGGVD